MVTQVCNAASNEVWYVDSGCTSHMAKDESLFSSLDRNDRTRVKLGNGNVLQASGKGNVLIHTNSGTKVIHDVLFIPDLDQNLLSVAQLLKRGYSLSFKDDCCVIVDCHDVEVARIKMLGNSFPVNFRQVKHAALLSKHDNSSIWHKRLGHFNVNALVYVQTHNMVEGLPEIRRIEDVCDACQYGKMHRRPFPATNVTRAKNKLELVHTDLCGPMSILSLNQSLYFLLFIDDFTRMTWVYFLANKAQTFDVFKKFKSMVEMESGCKLKVLRSDNGREYTSNRFNVFCEDMGIKHQLTVPYTPQQNGVSERKNRTVMEMARSLIAEKKLPKSFWAEAVHTSVYILNRLATKAVQGMTPLEAWTGLKPSVKHIKVFGSICYTHVADVKRTKLDEKAQLGIFIGYAVSSKGYRVYNVQTKKILVSRDVQFDEGAH